MTYHLKFAVLIPDFTDTFKYRVSLLNVFTCASINANALKHGKNTTEYAVIMCHHLD